MKKQSYILEGQIVDVISKKIFQGKVHVENGKISCIESCSTINTNYILPGLIDAHVHVESSMLIPSEFARLAVCHGTVATVSDPHEIGNVLGIEGVEFMIKNGKKVPFKFFFGAPSCVPATPFETSGATISAQDIDYLLQKDDVLYLTEMMNFPGVLHNDKAVMEKIALAKKHQKPVDGHAPGLKGKEALQYVNAGISTDHECSTIEEAVDKINAGMRVQIREGSAAKNFEALKELLRTHPDEVMLCSDDKHPDNLEEGHVNQLVKRALGLGYDFFNVIRAATVIPVEHYHLPVGLLQEGHPADMIVVDNLKDFNVLKTYINGELVAENRTTYIKSVKEEALNKFKAKPVDIDDIKVIGEEGNIKVIQSFDGELLTKKMVEKPLIENGNVVSDTAHDILKIVVLNRYDEGAKPSVAFIHGIGLKEGAFASCVAHDSHNIIAVGTSDEDIVKAMNLVIKHKGAISVVNQSDEAVLPLPVAGIMSNEDAYHVSKQYALLDKKVKTLGSKLSAPFMTLSFMALLVIPTIKLSDKGLFDGNNFKFTKLFD